MRARGAKAVDIVVLVVAADDGVMPHDRVRRSTTRARPRYADRRGAEQDRQARGQPGRGSRAAHGATGSEPEEWGGDDGDDRGQRAQGAPGVDELLERVFLESEVLELKSPLRGARPRASCSRPRSRRARAAWRYLLIQDGTLNRGDMILAGEGYGRVRSMHDDRGKAVDRAPARRCRSRSRGSPSCPSVGDAFYVVDELASAQGSGRGARAQEPRDVARRAPQRSRNENLMQAVADAAKRHDQPDRRADVQGSVEVLKQQLDELQHEEVDGQGAARRRRRGDRERRQPGRPTSNAMVLAFHVGVQRQARAGRRARRRRDPPLRGHLRAARRHPR